MAKKWLRKVASDESGRTIKVYKEPGAVHTDRHACVYRMWRTLKSFDGVVL